MKARTSSRIALNSARTRLLFLVLLAVIPALGLALFTGLQYRRQASQNVQNEALRLARLVSDNYNRRVEGARQLLVGIGQLPVVRQHDAAACTSLLVDIGKQFPMYTTLAALDIQGNVFCSSAPLSGPVNLSDRAYFQEALATHQMVISDFVVGRITGKNTMVIAYPAVDTAGSVQAVVIAGVDLSGFTQLAQEVQFPQGAVLLMLDSQGVILARSPDPDKKVGQQAKDVPVVQAILAAHGEGTVETKGTDGVRRLYGFLPLNTGTNHPDYLAVGFEASSVYAEANRFLWLNLAALGGVALLALAAAWLLGDALFFRQIGQLLSAAAAWGAGNLSARTGLTRGPDEFIRLGQAFDEMAASIHQRELLLQQAEETARQRAAEAEEGKRILETLMDNIPEGITIAEAPDVRIRMISRYGQQLTARPDRRLENVSLDEQSEIWTLRRSDDSAELPPEEFPLTRAVLKGEVITNEEILMVQPGGRKIPLLCTASPIRDREGKIIGGAIAWRDITERKQAAEALQKYADELARSNRELQDFAYIASHDLQEPLRKVQAFGERLASGYAAVLDETGQDYLRRMTTSAGRMQTMINDLLTYSRVATRGHPFQTVVLPQVLEEVVSDLETRLEQTGGRVEIGLLPVIEADPAQMRQLFQNLIGNALKFHRPGLAPLVQVSATSQPAVDTVQICVQDNGIGFEEKYLDRIFQPFQRLHGRHEYEGSGIGLAICRKIVERHGGALTARSVLGEGATFIITLPIQQNHTQPGGETHEA